MNYTWDKARNGYWRQDGHFVTRQEMEGDCELPETKPISLNHTSKELVDFGLSLPRWLACDDGRILWIKSWEPHTTISKTLTVTIEAFIDLPVDKTIEASTELTGGKDMNTDKERFDRLKKHVAEKLEWYDEYKLTIDDPDGAGQDLCKQINDVLFELTMIQYGLLYVEGTRDDWPFVIEGEEKQELQKRQRKLTG